MDLWTTFREFSWWKKIGVFIFIIYLIGIIYQLFIEDKNKYRLDILKYKLGNTSYNRIAKKIINSTDTTDGITLKNKI